MNGEFSLKSLGPVGACVSIPYARLAAEGQELIVVLDPGDDM